MKNKLPLSPHLQIYKPQMTSVLSITHRITGFCLSLTLPFYLIWLISLLLGESSYSFFVEICSIFFIKMVFVLMTYGLVYHMLNGIRHLFWDFGFGISIKTSSITGSIIIFLSVSITVFLALKFILK